MTQKYSDTKPHCPEDNHPRKTSTITAEVEKKRKGRPSNNKNKQKKTTPAVTPTPAKKQPPREVNKK